MLAPLNDFREKMLFVRGLYNEQALKGNIHSSQTGNLLSGSPLASGGEIRSGTSVDQHLAATYGRSTKVPSLVLGLREVEPVGPQELFDALQLAHLVDLADDPDAARTLSRPGLRPALQGRGPPGRQERARRRARRRQRPPPPGQHHRPGSSSTSTSNRSATSSGGSRAPASAASFRAGGRRSTSPTSPGRPRASPRTSPTTCG